MMDFGRRLGRIREAIGLAVLALVPIGLALLSLWVLGYEIGSRDDVGEALDRLSGSLSRRGQESQFWLFLMILGMFGLAIVLGFSALRSLWSAVFLGPDESADDEARPTRRHRPRHRRSAPVQAEQPVAPDPEAHERPDSLSAQPDGPAAKPAEPQGARFCPACGQPVQPGARFCTSCGQPLPA